MQRYFLLFLLFFILSGPVSLAQTIDSVEVNARRNLYTVKGSAAASANVPVEIAVLYPGQQAEDLSEANPGAVIAHIGETVTDTEGKYSFSGIIRGDSGAYTIQVRIGEALAAQQFFFTNSEAISAMLSILNNQVSEDAFADVFQREMAALHYSAGLYQDASGKEAIARAMYKSKPFDSPGNFDLALIRISLAQYISENSGDKVWQALERYPVECGIDKNSIYEKFIQWSQPRKKSVGDLLGKKSYDSMESLAREFVKAAVLEGLAKAAGYGEVYRLIDENPDLPLDLTGYKQLQSTAAVDKYIYGVGFSGFGEFEAKFLSLVASAQKAEKSPPPAGTPGGTSSGGSRSVPVVLSPDANTAEAQAPQASQYRDLIGYEWAVDAVKILTEKNIIQGRGDKAFAPADPITREEFVKMLIMAFGLFDKNAVYPFADVEEGFWAQPYIASAKLHGITDGVTDGLFGTGGQITREDMAAMLFRTLSVIGKSRLPQTEKERFADYEEISEYAKTPVSALYSFGVLNGMGNGMFEPKSSLNRAQAAVALANVLRGLEQEVAK